MTTRPLSNQDFDDMRRESAARRVKHPTWPSHKPSLHEPNGRVTVFETMPVGKAKSHKGYCKYCYRTHRNWWLMDERENYLAAPDDTPDRLLLCGHCEHTSTASMTER
jgi:hypothetical protein